MRQRNAFRALTATLALALTAAACGGDGADRSALEQDELRRELDLALQGDTAMTIFEDTAEARQDAAAENVPRQQAPAPRQPQPRPVTPTPAPRTESPAPAPRAVSRTASTGTSVTLTLNETLGTDRNQAGDAFTARVSQDVTDSEGNVVIPAGATVRGRITQVQPSGRVGQTAVMNLAFEAVSFDGATYPLQATVVRTEPEKVSGSSTAQQAGKVAAGAAAGAILGQVLGKDTKSTLKGAVIGAVAGTAVAMGTADVDAVLPAGSEMVIRLDGPVTVRRVI
ncbi:MAG: hypothetical protein WEB88_02935 [Gemmatimonadota bacterium]